MIYPRVAKSRPGVLARAQSDCVAHARLVDRRRWVEAKARAAR